MHDNAAADAAAADPTPAAAATAIAAPASSLIALASSFQSLSPPHPPPLPGHSPEHCNNMGVSQSRVRQAQPQLAPFAFFCHALLPPSMTMLASTLRRIATVDRHAALRLMWDGVVGQQVEGRGG